MKPVEIKELYDNTEKYIDKEVETCGWVRSIRDSKTFGFITVNDGTFFKPIQVFTVINLIISQKYQKQILERHLL